MKIMVVDDDKITRQVISHKLESKGYEVICAAGGMEALELINKKNLDLILCDIMMPDMSGLDILSLLKHFYFSKTPVILISSIKDVELINKSFDMGAYEYITKPVNLNELVDKIEMFKKKFKIA